jgi:hypothetical protein
MKLRIALGVPNHFAPKARYAIRVLLAPYKIDIEWCELADLSEYGGCYYGPMPIPDNKSEKPIFCINSESKTWEYFESKESYANPSHFLIRDYSGTALPVLFGKEGITSSVANQQCLEADLIASAFYWLSDWQENTRSDRDTHDRLLFKASLQEKMDIGYRAVVDEYGEYLIRFLGLDPEQVRRNKQVRSVFTHDIDRIQKKTAGILVRESLDYLILNRLKKPLSERISRWVQALRQYRGSTDAYQASINRLLEYASKHQLPSTFFLKSILERHLHDGNDYLSTDYFSQIRTALQKQPYEVGYHSGYLAGFKPALLTKEWEQLNQAVGMSVKIHRSHYLRYKPSVTFPALADLHFQVDSSIAWADHIGFRAQTSQPYPIFDCASNRELPILEIPLSVMDTQYFGYMKLSIDQAIEHIARLLDTIDRHKGVIVWNFHHHIYDPLDAPGWSKVLEFAHERSKHYENTSLSHLYIENQYYYGQ